MMSKFSSNIALLRKYVNGELSPREMHEIERASHEDEMLMDILLGLEQEKKMNLNGKSTEDIHKKIEDRITNQPIKRPWYYNRSYQAAASIILLISVAGFLFWSKQKDRDKVGTIIVKNEAENTQPVERNDIIENHTLTDSMEQLATESRIKKLPSATEHLYRAAPTRQTSDRALTDQEKQILAYTPAEKNIEINQNITGSLNIGHPKYENDVIVINTESNDNKSNLIAANSRKTLQSKVGNAAISSNPNMQPSAAQMRARLNSMGLDPQTSFILGQVIDQQSREPITGVQVKDLQTNKVVITDEEGRFAYAANNKKNLEINAFGYKPKEIAAENGEQTILLTPDENMLEEVTLSSSLKNVKSSPSIGWTKYNKQMHEEIAKLTNIKYEFKIRMELDRKGKPTRINFLKSTHSNLNASIAQLIEKGPIWEKGSDWKNIYLQFKSDY